MSTKHYNIYIEVQKSETEHELQGPLKTGPNIFRAKSKRAALNYANRKRFLHPIAIKERRIFG